MMASFLRHSKLMVQRWRPVRNLAGSVSKNQQQFFGPEAVKKITRADKVNLDVKFRLRDIMQENGKYQKTLHQPWLSNKYVPQPLTPTPASQEFLDIVSKDTIERYSLEYVVLQVLTEVNSFKDFDINICLYALDTLFVHNIDIEHVLREFLALLDIHWFALVEKGSLTTRHVVQALFLVGIIRNAPVTLFQYAEDYLATHLDDLDIRELSLVCHSFFVSNRRLTNFELVTGIADRLLVDHHKCPLLLLGNFMKMFHHSGYNSTKYFLKLGDALSQRKDLSKLRSLSFPTHLLSMYCSIRVIHKELFKIVTEGVEMSLRTTAKPERYTKELSRIAWALTSLQEPVPQSILSTLVNELKYNAQHYLSRVPETVIEALVTLIINSVYPQELLAQVFAPDFLKYKQGRLLEQEFQLQMLESSVKLNLPSLNLNHHFKNLDGNLEETRTSIEMHLSRRVGLKPLLHGLLDLVPNPSCIGLHYILPFSKIPDIELSIDSHGVPAKLKHGLTPQIVKQLSQHRLPSRTKETSVLEQLGFLQPLESHSSENLSNIYLPASAVGHTKRVVIKVHSWNQYTKPDTRLLALSLHELKLLNQLGYHVIGINPLHAQQLEDMTKEEIKSYINSKIFSQLKE